MNQHATSDVPLDDTCPYCGERAGCGPMVDCSSRRCGSCGKLVVAIEWVDGTMSLIEGEWRRDPRSGRQRTRALWRKRGRR